MKAGRVDRLVLSLAALALLSHCRDGGSSEEKTEPVVLHEANSERSNEVKAPKPATTTPTDQPDPRAVYYVPLRGDEPQKGPDDALFTIVAFGDYQCPFCKRMEPVLEQLLENHPNEVRLVWMNYPIAKHANARAAATAALEAQSQKGNDGYWQMHDLLFENQRALGRSDLERYAQKMGLDMREFRKALETDKYGSVIDRQIELGNRLGFRGTPAFYMNGRFIPGLPLKTWEGGLKLRRPLYEQMLRSGVPKSGLYEAIIANGKPGL